MSSMFDYENKNGYHDYEEVLIKKEEDNAYTEEFIQHCLFSTKKIKVFIDSVKNFNFDIKNNGASIKIGYIKEKKFLKIEKKEVLFSSEHSTYWGSKRTSKHHMLNISIQAIKDNIGTIYCDSTEDKSLYGLYYTYAKKNNKLDDFYCLNLLANMKEEKVSHTIDPLNPMIPFKDSFLNIFNLSKNIFSDLFYNLVKSCYDNNIAVESTLIFSLISLKTLIKCENEILLPIIKHNELEIKNYLKLLELENENYINVEKLEQNSKAVQLHYNYVKNIIHVNKIIQNYEEIGVFSIYAQINLNQIIKQNKILLILLPEINKNANNKFICNIVLTHLLTLENEIINNLDNSLYIYENEFIGFLTVQLFDEVCYILNEHILNYFIKLLERKNSRKIFTSIAISKYSDLSTQLEKISKNKIEYFLNLFEQQYFLYQTNIFEEIPMIVKEKVLNNCEKFDNIFHKKSIELINLTLDSFYNYMKISIIDNKGKYEYKGLLRKMNFDSINYICTLEKNISLLEHQILRK